MWRHNYVVSAYIATLPYVTLSCPIVSYHVRYFTGFRENNSRGNCCWLPVIHNVKFTGFFFFLQSIEILRAAVNAVATGSVVLP